MTLKDYRLYDYTGAPLDLLVSTRVIEAKDNSIVSSLHVWIAGRIQRQPSRRRHPDRHRRDINMKLTTQAVAKLALPAGKTDAIFWDYDLAGFGVRVRAGGSKTFVIQYEVGPRTRRMTIGSANKLTLPQARSAAKGELAKVELGQDPQGEKKAERAIGTFKSVAEEFIRFMLTLS